MGAARSPRRPLTSHPPPLPLARARTLPRLSSPLAQTEITAELESTDVAKKISALKKTIMLVLAGEEMPRVMMTVIRYCITVENHALQKLLMLYYECVRKYDAAGKLLPEMILVWCVGLPCARAARASPPPPLPAAPSSSLRPRAPRQRPRLPTCPAPSSRPRAPAPFS